MYLWEKYCAVKNYLKLLAFGILPVAAFAQSPEFSVYGGLPIFITDAESDFSFIGGKIGGFDGWNSTLGAELQLPIWNDLSMHGGLDLYSIQAKTSLGSSRLTGISPRLGLGYSWAFTTFQLQAKGSLGLGMIRTIERNQLRNSNTNPGLYTWGSLSAPASLGLRASLPYGPGRVYAELTYRYFMFDDGLDGTGGGGTRVGGHDDQMLIGVAGYTWNLTKAQSRTQRELVQAKRAAESVPTLKRSNEELKVAQAELEDELEVVKIQKSKLEQQLDSVNQGYKAPNGTQDQLAGTSAGSASEAGIRYVVVVGSFRSSRLAAQYVSRLKEAGVNCSTTEGANGFVRVYTGPYTSESVALSTLDKVRAETPGAWLLRL